MSLSRIRGPAVVVVLLNCTACCPGPATDWYAANRVPAQTDPVRGRRVIEQFGCGDCHVIPGVAGAHGLDGPPLLWFARRGYVAGVLPNTFENVVAFLESPPSVHPRSAMPTPGLGHHQASDVAAYLYTLH